MGGKNEALRDVRSIDTQDHSKDASWKDMPSLQVGRENASACYTNGKLFVFGGYVLHKGNLSSVEVLDLANSLDHHPKWEQIEVDPTAFAPCKSPVVVPTSDTSLVIFSGDSKRSDIVHFDSASHLFTMLASHVDPEPSNEEDSAAAIVGG